MCFEVGLILGLFATAMAPLLSSSKVELEKNLSFSLSITKFLTTSFRRLFNRSNYITELDNVIY